MIDYRRETGGRTWKKWMKTGGQDKRFTSTTKERILYVRAEQLKKLCIFVHILYCKNSELINNLTQSKFKNVCFTIDYLIFYRNLLARKKNAIEINKS